jgi:hypothetical protein
MAAKKNKKVNRVAKKVARILPVRNEDGTWHVKNTPVVNTDGAVIMNPPIESTDQKDEKSTTLKPSLDKETGVLVMVPVTEDKK